MKQLPKQRPKTIHQKLEDLYWEHWIGFEEYARRQLIKLTDDYLKGKPSDQEEAPETKGQNVLLPLGGTNGDDYRGAFAD